MSRLDLSSSLFGLSIPVSGIFWNLDWVMNHLGDWSLFPALHCLQINFPGGSDSKESSCSVGDLGLIMSQEDPLEKGMATHSSILA